MPHASKQALLDLLTVERHAPGPRPPRTVASCDSPAPITPEQAAEHRRVLMDAIGRDATVIAFRERQAS